MPLGRIRTTWLSMTARSSSRMMTSGAAWRGCETRWAQSLGITGSRGSHARKRGMHSHAMRRPHEDFLSQMKTIDNLDMLASDMEDGLELFPQSVRIGEGRVQDITGLSDELIRIGPDQDIQVRELQHQLDDAVERRKHLEDRSLACSQELSEQRKAIEEARR